MNRFRRLLSILVLTPAGVRSAVLAAVLSAGLDHPAIAYATAPVHNAASELNLKLQSGGAQLRYESSSGYLRYVLAALAVPVESQMMVFSKTSLQQAIIGPENPRAVYFNDSVVVAWVRGEPFVEIAAHDDRQGVIFYTLDQNAVEQPRLARRDFCLTCHLSHASLGVPGMMVRSVFPDATGTPQRELGEFLTDHRSPFSERWGGWYVTGKTGPLEHMGRAAVTLQAYGHLTPNSDAVALMVFEHQMRMMNLITRAGWETRLVQHSQATNADRTIDDAVTELVDYLVFAGEAPLPGPVSGTSGFAENFAARGPRDSKGRSLRQLDLTRRLMRYPCSYMIYSDAFEALPEIARAAIYRRLWRILSGEERDARYAGLSPASRRAVVEILSETKPGLPYYFRRSKQ